MDQLFGYERFSGFKNEAKLTYIRLNSQTPRGAIPVNQGGFFTLNTRIVFGHGCDCTNYVAFRAAINASRCQRPGHHVSSPAGSFGFLTGRCVGKGR
jgi:hypothetical protein